MALLRIPMHALLPPVFPRPLDMAVVARLAHDLRRRDIDLDPVHVLKRDDGLTWRLIRGRTAHAAYLAAGRRDIPAVDGSAP